MIAISYMRGDNAAGRFADLYAQETDFDIDVQTFKVFAKEVGEIFLPKEIEQTAERKLKVMFSRFSQWLLCLTETTHAWGWIQYLSTRMTAHSVHPRWGPKWNSRIHWKKQSESLRNRKLSKMRNSSYSCRSNSCWDCWSQMLQGSTFWAQGGVPMDISKACTEGKCFKCRKPWPCQEHFKPHAWQVRNFQYWGQKIEYTMVEKLEMAITQAKQDFPKGE